MITVFGHFKLFWRVPFQSLMAAEDKFQERILFANDDGTQVTEAQKTQLAKLDGSLHRDMAMNDTNGELYPVNPKMLFKDADVQTNRGGWMTFTNQKEANMVMIKMQIEADITIASEVITK